ncbi:MAG: hypothetical protein V1749_10040, partial [Candidatus Desantisbacteria bacterium]
MGIIGKILMVMARLMRGCGGEEILSQRRKDAERGIIAVVRGTVLQGTSELWKWSMKLVAYVAGLQGMKGWRAVVCLLCSIVFVSSASASFPTVYGEGMAPDTMVPGITDTDDLLKVIISGSSTDTGTITWQMLDIKFTSNGVATLTTAQFQSLFENIYFYLDNGDGVFQTSDTRIATFTALSITLNDNGVATFTLPSTTDFQVVSPGTKTYFIVGVVQSGAGLQGTAPRNFVLTIDTNGTATPGEILRNQVVWGAGSSTVVNYSPPAALVNSHATYTLCTAKAPAITIYNTAPSCLKDSQQDDLFRIYILRQGGTGGADHELSYLKVRFTDSSSGQPLSTATIQELFDNIKVYKDTGNNQFESGTDTCVGTLTSNDFAVNTNGILTMNLLDGSEDLKLPAVGSATYFVAVTMKNTSSGQLATFKANINAGTSTGFVGIEDRAYDVFVGVDSGNSSTATTSPIPIDAAINVYDIAPSSISDEDENGLLKITVTNNGVTGAGGIELANYLKVKFTKDSGGTNTLSTTDVQTLFSYIYVYRDNGDGSFNISQDSLVGTYTPELITGVQQITFVDNASTSTINAATSTNFFVAVKLTSNASTYATHTFVAIIDADNDVAVRDSDSNATVGHNVTSPVQSSLVTCVVKKPDVDVTDTAPVSLGEGSKDDILKIVLKNTASSGGAIEFAGLDVVLTTNGTSTPLATSDAQALFSYISVYRDNGDGVYASSSDTACIGSVSSGSITLASNGSLTLTFLDGDTNCQVTANGSQTYFLVVEIKGTASAYATRTFAATIHEELYPVIETAADDIRLSLTAGNNATSSVTTIVPANPSVNVMDTAPGTGKMTDGQVEDMLKLSITHNGISGSNPIEFASLTVTLTDGSS